LAKVSAVALPDTERGGENEDDEPTEPQVTLEAVLLSSKMMIRFVTLRAVPATLMYDVSGLFKTAR
jgi:hypothetical protein